MICPELIQNRSESGLEKLKAGTDFSRFEQLHPEGQKLIRGWFGRAWKKRNCKPEDSFEPFIFAWIAFNGWGACVTGLDSDRDYVDALAMNDSISQHFADHVAKTTPFGEIANQFHSLLPIFQDQDIRRHPTPLLSEGSREVIVDRYFCAGLKRFAPQCAKRHREAMELIPLDWAHTLAALYRIRCNLFHGEKRAHAEMDQLIVSKALHVLIYFFNYLITGEEARGDNRQGQLPE